MAEVEVREVTKVYPGEVVGVARASFTIPDKSFTVVVGPSGSGKTTLLRMIAGLEEITSGDLLIDSVRVNDKPPKDRDIAMVFQNYALYPHMSVYENMAFGLRLRKIPRAEIDRRVRDAAQFLQLEGLLDRRPKALSGGQRQRVALGRALVRNPKVFLFDEPLSNLDASLRLQTRTELAKLHQRIEATMVYVTHDQIEAMTLADQIVVMTGGRVQQIGPPLELYRRPANKFVAGFIGSPPMNFFSVEVVERDGGLFLTTEGLLVRTTPEQADRIRSAGLPGRSVTFGIRPEHMHDRLFLTNPPPEQTVKAVVEVVEPTGAETYAQVRIGRTTANVRLVGQALPKEGQEMDLVFEMSRAHAFHPETEAAIF